MFMKSFMIAAMRGRNPENPSERAKSNGNYRQTLEPNRGGVSNTITSVQKDNLVVEHIAQPIKRERTEAEKLRRHLHGDKGAKFSSRQMVPGKDGVMGAITTVTEKDNLIMEQGNYEHNEECGMPEPVEARPKGKGWKWIPEEMCWVRLRKLTPKECFRLMDMKEQYIARIQTAVFPDKKGVIPVGYGVPDSELKQVRISDSQQYKMAGNSIVVACLEGIFNNLFTDGEVEKETLF